MHWQMVQIEEDSSIIGRGDTRLLVSPPMDQLTERAQDQVRKVYKMIQLACKSELAGAGKVRVNASGYAHHEDQMPTDQRDFFAISVGRIG